METVTRILLPSAIIIAISLMYFMSVDLTNFSRADAAMILMILVAAFNLYIACKWYLIGFMTFQRMQKVEKTATSIIDSLMKQLPKDKAGNILETVVEKEIDNILERVKEINKG